MPKVGMIAVALLLASVSCGTVQTFAPDDPKVTWAVYGLVDGKPKGEPVELRPGDVRNFGIASNFFFVGTHDPMPLRTPPTHIGWSIEPSGKGVEISAGGRLSVGPRATIGNYIVRAEAAAETRTISIRVYDPQRAPLVGSWTEATQISCSNGSEIQPPVRMLELSFEAGGSFSATWMPFETRKDYWGTYEYSPATGNLILEVADIFNYKPPDLVLQGTVTVDTADGRRRMQLKGLWLGAPPPGLTSMAAAAPPRPACGHVFVSK